MSRHRLTVRKINSRRLKAKAGKRVDHPDKVVPGLALRVNDTGHKTFVLVARYPLHPKNATRRTLAMPARSRSIEPGRRRGRGWR
jgi:hypothetical protein